MNATALHVGNLSKNSEDELADASRNAAEAVDLNGYALVQQRANSGLHIKRIASQAIDCIDVDHVTLACVGQQASESGPLCCRFR